ADLIPPHLPADTAIRIWEELQKPFSEKDEPGYIYVFLLTDKPRTPAPTAAAAASPTRFLKAAAAHSPASNQKLLLKIGRAVCFLPHEIPYPRTQLTYFRSTSNV